MNRQQIKRELREIRQIHKTELKERGIKVDLRWKTSTLKELLEVLQYTFSVSPEPESVSPEPEEDQEALTVKEALATAANARNYTPIHEARMKTSLSVKAFRQEMLTLVEAGEIQLSSLQEGGTYPKAYMEDAITMDIGSSIWFFYIVQ